jgi:SAM-dependent methyltransferase
MDSTLLPILEYGSRIQSGRDAQGLVTGVAVSPNDPCLSLTYGEFPLSSFDQLLDLALPHVVDVADTSTSTSIRMVDVGSGFGRLALYAALTRGTPEQPWHVHGIEISPILHHLATLALSRGFQNGVFTHYNDERNNTTDIITSTMTNTTSSILHLHLGAAEDWTRVLQQCNLVFLYSTVFSTSGFSEEWGAMILDQEWSGLLSQNCPTGCVVVTTDRALDPNDGWELLDRLDVENREVMGSTGYIHVLLPK